MEHLSDSVRRVIVREHKREIAEELEDIGRELEGLVAKESEDSAHIGRVVRLQLQKASILTASYVLFQQMGEPVLTGDIDNLIQMLESVLKLQRKNEVHHGIHLVPKEIRDNFRFWNIVPAATLFSFLAKEHYLLSVIENVLASDKRWLQLLAQLHCDLAISSQNFINIEACMRNNAARDPDLGIIKKTVALSVDACKIAARTCTIVYGYNKKNYQWLGKAMQFLLAMKNIANLKENNETLRNDIDSRIKRVVKQFNSDRHLYSEKITIKQMTQQSHT